ncbi:MAG: HAMP domain-containing histidine kinase [Geodermatophilaceae bacterium]|nr:HAMP domain-containing histidine kinase [Geodermatophilaceae bacterium]
MRRRLSLLFLSLVAGVLMAVGVPLSLSYAETTTQALFIDRAADASRFAQLAAPALARGDIDTVQSELDAYAEVYGIRVDVFDATGQLLVSGEPGSEAETAMLTADSAQRRAALLGRGPETPPIIFPWRTDPVTVAAPILQGMQVVGAVVTVSPTDRTRADILTRWLALTGAGLLTVVAAGLLTVPLSRWMLRPVNRLDEAVQTMTSGDYEARVPVESGPPELRQLTLGFNTMAAAVSRSLTQQRALIADASHQLRNPLSALRLRVEDLTDSLPDEDRDRGHKALAEMDRLTQLLDDTLTFARAEGDPQAMVAVDLSRCARDRLQAWSDLAERKEVALVLDAPVPTWVTASGGAVEQMLDALLDNAIRFTPGGTIHVVVEERNSMTVLLSVRDDGAGLTGEQCDLAVRRFWTGPDQQNVAGSGLGLSIVDTLAARLGGSLSLRPAVPHGLVAEISLPRLGGAGLDDVDGLAVTAARPGSSAPLPDAMTPARS